MKLKPSTKINGCKRRVLDSMSMQDLARLLRRYTQKEISKIYGISETYVSIMFTQKEVHKLSKQKSLNYSIKKECFSKNEDDYGWVNTYSEEYKIPINQYKKCNNLDDNFEKLSNLF